MTYLYYGLAALAIVLATLYLRKPVLRLQLKALIWFLKKVDRDTGEFREAIEIGEKALEEDLKKIG